MVTVFLSDDSASSFWDFYKRKRHCDVEIRIENTERIFHCHKIVLSENSPFFKRHFDANKRTTIILPSTVASPEILELGIELIYKHEMEIPYSKLKEFTNMSIFLELEASIEADEEIESNDESFNDVHQHSIDFLRHDTPEPMSLEIPSESAEFSIDSSLNMSDEMNCTLSALELSRRWKNNHLKPRPRKSLMNFIGPYQCQFCPDSPFFGSKKAQTMHELNCTFNPESMK